MLGFESLEKKLREEAAPSAKATVTKAKAGIPISEGSNDWDQTDVTRYHYTLEVEPDDGLPSFEGEAAIRVNHLKLNEGDRAVVLFDPSDHSRIAFDVEATNALRERGPSRGRRIDDPDSRSNTGDAPPAPNVADDVDVLQKLADLHAQGALTDAEFAAEKAKILGS
jgi:hypothetical protein